jgi:hypothetical protein
LAVESDFDSIAQRLESLADTLTRFYAAIERRRIEGDGKSWLGWAAREFQYIPDAPPSLLAEMRAVLDSEPGVPMSRQSIAASPGQAAVDDRTEDSSPYQITPWAAHIGRWAIYVRPSNDRGNPAVSFHYAHDPQEPDELELRLDGHVLFTTEREYVDAAPADVAHPQGLNCHRFGPNRRPR